MKRLVLLWALAGVVWSPVAAQTGGTAGALARASQAYEQLDVEQALAVLRGIISPSWAQEVTSAQRVETYEYLGACHALAGRADSATHYFRAAVDADPFAELDPRRFTPAQVALFQAARRTMFRVAVRPVDSVRVDPRAAHVDFRTVTTRPAALRVEVRGPATTTADTVFQGPSQGARDIPWDGLLRDGRLAPPGRYQLVVTAATKQPALSDSAHVFFDVMQETATLEDTLPDLLPSELLPERVTAAAAVTELLKGLGIAGFAAFISSALPNRDLKGGMRAGAGVVAGGAALTGVVAFVRRRHAPIPENVAANERRRAARAASHQAIRERNAAKRAATVLVVTPAAGIGP
jgi:hypothetical protein